MPSTKKYDLKRRGIEGRYITVKVMRGSHPINNDLDFGLVTYLKGKFLYGLQTTKNRESWGEIQRVLVKRLQGVRVMDPPRGGVGRPCEGSIATPTRYKGKWETKRGRSKATWDQLHA